MRLRRPPGVPRETGRQRQRESEASGNQVLGLGSCGGLKEVRGTLGVV